MSVDKPSKKNAEKETHISHISSIHVNIDRVGTSDLRKKSALARQPGLCAEDQGGAESVRDISERNYDTFTSSTNRFIVNDDIQNSETHSKIGKQICVPFLISGFGMVGAGFYLNFFEEWEVFRVPGIPVLIPVLLGLKGNLEMTAASRLSTVFHVGIANYKEFFKIIVGNFSLVQGQALIVSLLAAHAAMFLLVLKSEDGSKDIWGHLVFLASAAMLSASLASIVLQFVTMNVMLLCRWLKINPDNVATQTVGSMGDLVSLIFFSTVSSLIYRAGSFSCHSAVIAMICVSLIPLWFLIAYNIKYTRSVMGSGWVPLIVAMFITVVSGVVFSDMIKAYPGIASLQPVLNGVGGSLVSVQASRLSSMLHCHCDLGILPSNTKVFINPWTLFTSKEGYSTTVRVLLIAVIPGQLIFIVVIGYIKAERFTPFFIMAYIFIAFLQVFILLLICHILTHFLWSKNTDPDLATIPYMTALGDLLGAVFLGYTFRLFQHFGLQYKNACYSLDTSECS